MDNVLIVQQTSIDASNIKRTHLPPPPLGPLLPNDATNGPKCGENFVLKLVLSFPEKINIHHSGGLLNMIWRNKILSDISNLLVVI